MEKYFFVIFKVKGKVMTFSLNSFSGSPIKPSQESGWNKSPNGVSKRGSHNQPTGKLGFKKVKHDTSERLSDKVESAKAVRQNNGESLISTEISSKKIKVNPKFEFELEGIKRLFVSLKGVSEKINRRPLKELVRACEEKGLEYLLQIKLLNLSGLKLTELPEEIGLLTNLETLNINDNELASLPETLSSLSKLRCVEMGYNQFRELPPVICQIARERMANKKYFELYLTYNPISEIAADLKPIIRVNPNYFFHFIEG